MDRWRLGRCASGGSARVLAFPANSGKLQGDGKIRVAITPMWSKNCLRMPGFFYYFHAGVGCENPTADSCRQPVLQPLWNNEERSGG